MSGYFPPIISNTRMLRKRMNPEKQRRHLRAHFEESPNCRECGRLTFRADQPDGRQANNTATLGHIIPRAEGGSDSRENTRLECRGCNAASAGPIHFRIFTKALHAAAPNRLFGVTIRNGEAV